MNTDDLPIAVIGGGPVGLAAAAHLLARGLPVRLYEAGERAGANVRSWGHVRLFSPWRFNIDPTAALLLRNRGWQEPPADSLPTGRELVDAYLAPLAETLGEEGIVETRARVHSVSRQGIDKMATRDRASYPFALAIDGDNGRRIDLARAVIDASGTWTNPNPMGASGLAIPNEDTFAARIAYGIPDVLGAERATYAGQRILVIGGGHSAANVLLDLAHLAESDAHLRLIWAVRSQNLSRVFGGGEADRLPARGKLGSDVKRMVKSGRLQVVTGFAADRIEKSADGIAVSNGTGSITLPAVDRVVVATGQRPDLNLTRELRLDLDPWIEFSRALGPLIDPNLHSCGTVPPHGHKELAHPEAGYFAVGIKSYGRAPTFLMATGFEQVRSVTALLAGDQKAADDVRLVLPETGVCTSNIPAAKESASGCCGGPAPAPSDACCVADAEAKAQGSAGCGCSAAA